MTNNDADKTEDLQTRYRRLAAKLGPTVVGIPKGWVEIVEDFVDGLAGIPAEPQFEIRQIKEKLGGLRLYFRGDETSYALKHYAESRSLKTCQVCGAPGELRQADFGLLATLCDEHADIFFDDSPGVVDLSGVEPERIWPNVEPIWSKETWGEQDRLTRSRSSGRTQRTEEEKQAIPAEERAMKVLNDILDKDDQVFKNLTDR